MRTIYLVNLSKLISDKTVAAIAFALSIQAYRDLAPAWWGIEVSFQLGSINLPVGSEILWLVDGQLDPSTLGEHSIDGITPWGVVDIQGAINSGTEPSEVISHEGLEQAINPSVNDAILAPWNGGLAALAKEICDPVEGTGTNYRINGFKMANFVLPQWFMPNSNSLGKVDWYGDLPTNASFRLSLGGYQSFTTDNGVTWSSSYGQETIKTIGSSQSNANLFRRFGKNSRQDKRRRYTSQNPLYKGNSDGSSWDSVAYLSFPKVAFKNGLAYDPITNKLLGS